jgi:hypothetical protein
MQSCVPRWVENMHKKREKRNKLVTLITGRYVTQCCNMVQIGKGLSHYLWWLPNNSGGVLLCVEFKCRLLRLTRGSFSGSVFLMGRLFQYQSIGPARFINQLASNLLFRPIYCSQPPKLPILLLN